MIGVQKMKTNGVTGNKIRLTYKIAIILCFFSLISTLINIIFNIISSSDKVFFSSYYLLLVPYINFTKTHNYLEIIPFIIFLSISIVLFYKCAKDYFNMEVRRPYFTALALIWVSITMLSYAVYTTSHDIIPYDDIDVYNAIYSSILVIYLIIAMLVKICDVEKYTLSNPDPSNSMMFPQNFQLHAIDYKQIFRTALLNPIGFGFAFGGSILLRYLGVRAIKFTIMMYIVVAIIDIIVFIGVIYEYKRFVRLNEDSPPPRHFLRNINVMQIGLFMLLLITFIFLYLF